MKDDSGSGRSHTPKGKDSKNKILDMAEKVITEKGFAKASINEVVQALGISAGALYHHFPNKKALLEGIVQRSMNQLCALMDSWMEDERLTAEQKIQCFLKETDKRRKLKVAIEGAGFGLAREDRDIHEMAIEKGLEPISERIRLLIEEGNRSGEFSVQHPRATSVMMFMMLIEYMHRYNRLSEVAPAKELDATVHSLVKHLLYG